MNDIVTENRYRNVQREQREAAELEALRQEIAKANEPEKETQQSISDPNPTPNVDPEREKTFEKRYGDLRRHVQQKEESFKKEIAELKSQLSSLQKVEFPTSDADLSEWAQQYPDIYNRIVTIAMKESTKTSEQFSEKLKALEEREKELAKREAFKELLSYHPDFTSIVQTKEFKDWVETQPQYIYDALYVNETDAAAAKRAIDLYKLDAGMFNKKETKPDATRNFDAARQVRTPPTDAPPEKKIKFTESMVAKMKQADYEKHKPEIYEAMKHKEFFDLEAARM